MHPDPDPAAAAIRAAAGRMPSGCAAWGRGWCAALACLLEASAPKPGNVHPGASFPDLTHDELVSAGLAIAAPLDRAAAVPLGRTILDAVTATRQVTRSNANLGIVLAIAPLAAVPDAAGPLGAAIDAGAVTDVLARLDRGDAAAVWEAIAVANPGGMGSSPRWDVRQRPPDDLLEAMRLAAPRDQIARLWAEGYAALLAGPVRDLATEFAAGRGVADAIVRAHLAQLAREPDTLIARRHGPHVAADVSRRAAEVLARPGEEWRPAAAAFDHALRRPVRINPGTTADLLAAALYILLRDESWRRETGLGAVPPLDAQ